MVDETTENEPTRQEEELRVIKVTKDSDSLFIELASANRDDLTERGRQFAMDYVKKTADLAGWAVHSGVEKVSCPMAFDPTDADNDPYAKVPKTDTKWHYRQTLRIVRSPMA